MEGTYTVRMVPSRRRPRKTYRCNISQKEQHNPYIYKYLNNDRLLVIRQLHGRISDEVLGQVLGPEVAHVVDDKLDKLLGIALGFKPLRARLKMMVYRGKNFSLIFKRTL